MSRRAPVAYFPTTPLCEQDVGPYAPYGSYGGAADYASVSPTWHQQQPQQHQHQPTAQGPVMLGGGGGGGHGFRMGPGMPLAARPVRGMGVFGPRGPPPMGGYRFW